MNEAVKVGFEKTLRTLPLCRLDPLRKVTEAVKASPKFKQIRTSIESIGVIEPLAVYPQKSKRGRFLLLDGHIRREVLLEQGQRTALCLISSDEEGFTYNARLNRLTTVQEHNMILKAISRGVSEEAIAGSLGLSISHIKEKRNILNGLCPEVIDLLKHRNFSAATARAIRKVQPLRQIEMAELMIAANNFSASYAKAMVAATPQDQLTEPRSKATKQKITGQEIEKMEEEFQFVQTGLKSVEKSYGDDVLKLMIANGYLGRLLENAAVSSYLKKHHPITFDELQKVHENVSLMNR
ncbi:MAG: plasmid partitioning protein RepB C-terminal domain-containing protein [Pseudomonadota bacterium]